MMAIPTPRPVIPRAWRSRTPSPGFLPSSEMALALKYCGSLSLGGQIVRLSKSAKRRSWSEPVRSRLDTSSDRRSICQPQWNRGCTSEERTDVRVTRLMHLAACLSLVAPVAKSQPPRKAAARNPALGDGYHGHKPRSARGTTRRARPTFRFSFLLLFFREDQRSHSTGSFLLAPPNAGLGCMTESDQTLLSVSTEGAFPPRGS